MSDRDRVRIAERDRDLARKDLREANRKLEESERRYRRIFERTKDAILVSTPNGVLLDINPSGLELYEYASLEEMLPIDLKNEMWADPVDRDDYIGELREFGFVKDFEAAHRTRTGKIITVIGTTSIVRDGEGNILELLTILRDISEQKRLSRELELLARTDSLTGLSNRAVFRERLELALAQRRRSGTQFALIMVDVDNLKEVNDLHGHPAGDVLLTTIASRLRSSVREIDVVARFGGDEFAVIALGDQTESQAAETAARLVGCLEAPIDIAGQQLKSSISVGVAIPLSAETAADHLIQRADRALYRAKGRGGDQFSF